MSWERRSREIGRRQTSSLPLLSRHSRAGTARLAAGLPPPMETSGFLAGWGQQGAGALGRGPAGWVASPGFWKAHHTATHSVRLRRGCRAPGALGWGNRDPRLEEMGRLGSLMSLQDSSLSAVSRTQDARDASPLRCERCSAPGLKAPPCPLPRGELRLEDDGGSGAGVSHVTRVYDVSIVLTAHTACMTGGPLSAHPGYAV